MPLRTVSRSDLLLWGGPAAMLGGALWIAGAVMTALMPEGCMGSDCYLPGRSMRDTRAAAPISLSGLLLIGAGVAAVVSRARGAGLTGTSVRISSIASVAGATIIPAAVLVQAVFSDNDFPYMPLVVLPAGLALVVGCLLLGLTILRARLLRPWAGALLLTSSLALLGFNDQNIQALLGIPFGMAWVSIGYLLWSSEGV